MQLLLRPQIGFTYDCRLCEKPIMGAADLFPMHSTRYVCRCSCGESALVSYIRCGALVIEYPCSICGQRHRNSIPLDEVLQKGPIPLRCPITDTAACYAGVPESLSFMDSTKPDADIAAFVERLIGIQPALLDKPVCAADALCAARRLAREDGIRCHCGSLRFTAAYDTGRLAITCATCGSTREFPAASQKDIDSFLSGGVLML